MSRFSTLSQPRSEPQARGAVLAYLWAALAGLLVPVLVILVGVIALLLNSNGLSGTEVRLGAFLRIPISNTLTELAPLTQLTWLVGLTFMVATIFSVSVWLHRRAADARACRIVKSLHQRVLRQSLRRAELEGAAAQHVRAELLIGKQLPLVQKGLSLWYRAVPRSLLTLVGCVAVALMINVWLALLAVVSGVLLWQLSRRLRRNDESELNHWEVPRSRRRMAELVGQAPLLARLHSQGLADHAFQAELESLYRRIYDEDARLGRIWPILFFALSAAVAVMLLGLGVNLFGVDNGLSLPAALAIGLALGGAIAAAGRLIGLAAQLSDSGEASDAVYQYLHRSSEIAPSEQRVGLAGLRDGVEIRDVTLGDSNGNPILSHLSLSLKPKSFVAILGTDPVPTRALTELLMGFGTPSEGRVALDGIQLRDVHPQALARHVMWIEPDGPVWEGTIMENMRGDDESINNSDLVAALEEVDVYERLQRMPDGLSTIITPGDSSLTVETTYAMGVARALLHKPPIVLASEPPPPAEHLTNDPCLAALRKLSENGSLVVVLPRRLQTLRSADRVVLLNGPRLVGEGKHAELLADSDLYRHLNYLLFNPYRHSKV
ncbi:putative multidrug resistance ABC transporter ATP-binding/permease protein YheH [Rubripirellula lacrimiformis]|uniref:Putative multidrug resistance ABC transporter ATP-binding/permease protein YheH n=1 Tax=Rubripirellula lacrimiformis TaxID=1930273 RepID=A0A517NAR4_9BACT|nr:ABC transporter ATP-binding protein [Rubripirellula lacrimiformis]QDT04108.1 putative multidrug resistance ABC transporter ATP-binding/permease protein YheH [Rubripirellula lacrimiformis]